MHLFSAFTVKYHKADTDVSVKGSSPLMSISQLNRSDSTSKPTAAGSVTSASVFYLQIWRISVFDDLICAGCSCSDLLLSFNFFLLKRRWKSFTHKLSCFSFLILVATVHGKHWRTKIPPRKKTKKAEIYDLIYKPLHFSVIAPAPEVWNVSTASALQLVIDLICSVRWFIWGFVEFAVSWGSLW